MDITTLTIHEAKKMLDSGELTSYDLTKAYIDRIKEVDSLVKAYVTVCEEEALNKAKQIDEKRKNGEIIPISMIGFKLETYIKRNGLNTNIPLTFDNEELKVRIDRLQRNVLSHNIINIDTFEV